MKITKTVWFWLFIMSVKSANALEFLPIKDIKIQVLPSATPTTIKFIKPSINLEKIPIITLKSSATATEAPTNSPTIVPTETTVPEITESPLEQKPTEIPITISPTKEMNDENQAPMYLFGAIIIMLIVVIGVQIWVASTKTKTSDDE